MTPEGTRTLPADGSFVKAGLSPLAAAECLLRTGPDSPRDWGLLSVGLWANLPLGVSSPALPPCWLEPKAGGPWRSQWPGQPWPGLRDLWGK